MPTQTEAEAKRAAQTILWGSRALGFGLIVYAVLVMYGLVSIFPRSGPTRDLVTGLKTIADTRGRASTVADSMAMNAKPKDSLIYRRLALHADSLARSASAARVEADSLERAALDPALVPSPLRLFGLLITTDLAPDWRFLILAMFAGALGAFLHVAQSFATYVGNRTFEWSWTWWYLLRPFIGAGLAVVVYVVFRSALVPGTSANVANAYGVVALAALSGMFSKQAIDKLNEIFTVAFRSAPGKGDAERVGKPTGPTPPVIATIIPPQLKAVDGALSFAVTGTGFSTGACVFLDEVATTTKIIDPTRLESKVEVAKLQNASGPFKLTVRTPAAPGAPPGDQGTVAGPVTVSVG